MSTSTGNSTTLSDNSCTGDDDVSCPCCVENVCQDSGACSSNLTWVLYAGFFLTLLFIAFVLYNIRRKRQRRRAQMQAVEDNRKHAGSLRPPPPPGGYPPAGAYPPNQSPPPHFPLQQGGHPQQPYYPAQGPPPYGGGGGGGGYPPQTSDPTGGGGHYYYHGSAGAPHSNGPPPPYDARGYGEGGDRDGHMRRSSISASSEFDSHEDHWSDHSDIVGGVPDEFLESEDIDTNNNSNNK